ncbi:alpha/beta-hydrolase [Mollisia scopiformis]|uniref:Alpha/beta-hydrolase n=1 Tax=Mollisia scopiformis TaxID=149040 RepID=A0A194XPY1_MOLSC|nr:alpha/beta-hydrolase [Mollisia scopiformis]KUJ22315.1 alpha/beta-hydrolase [Mollisia scopiformis]
MVLGLHGHSHVDINSIKNSHPDPTTSIYPQLSPDDAPYQVQEVDMRSAIFIPEEFQYGRDGKVPVILVPGTGSFGGEAFRCNFAKLLKASNFGDPLWLNIPGMMCDDAAKNAEYVAYAINYISTTCSKKVAVIAWSQGNLCVQWSLKYWPSTRGQVSNFICLSADFRGTTNAWLMAPAAGVPCAPAVRQQRRRSKFITTLMSNGGDSAYVPTTSIYSRTDEVVQPQFGKWASALMYDERQVGVTNCEVQVAACKKPAGLYYTHFTLLYNPLAWAFTEDAICNGGPGRLDRIDMKCCMRTKTHGLNRLDVLRTKELIRCGKAILNYPAKLKYEPELPPYCAREEKTYVPDYEADIE